MEKTSMRALTAGSFSFGLYLSCLLASGGRAEGETGILPEGPWGTIEYSHFFLEMPDSYVRSVPVPSGRTVWRFPLASYPDPFGAIESILDDDPALFREFDETCTILKTVDELRIFPTDEIVERLTQEQRFDLYRELGKWSVNRNYARPIHIEAEDPREWFDREGISPGTRDAVAALAFRRGDTLLFSDIPYAIRLARDPVEEMSLRKAFSRTRSLLLKVRTPVSDEDEFVRYWSAEGRLRSVAPLLRSIARIEDTSTVSLNQILPPLARKHLYTYPSLGMVMDGAFPGSWWTSANFMRIDPDPMLLSRVAVLEHFESSYETIEEDVPRLPGDVILLIDRRTGRQVHSCVHVAADVVFTKRNNALSSPWTLSSLDRVRSGFINGRHIDYVFKRLVKKPYVPPLLGRPKRG